eukprot:6491375-Amphidinium_carterae.1
MFVRFTLQQLASVSWDGKWNTMQVIVERVREAAAFTSQEKEPLLLLAEAVLKFLGLATMPTIVTVRT